MKQMQDITYREKPLKSEVMEAPEQKHMNMWNNHHECSSKSE